MNCLLDNSAFLRYVFTHTKLSPQATNTIGDPGNSVYLSLARFWELAKKVRIGKLELTPAQLSVWLDKHQAVNSFRLQEIKVSHLVKYAERPPLHRDPYDGLLVAQSMVEYIPIITSDAAIDHYPIERIC